MTVLALVDRGTTTLKPADVFERDGEWDDLVQFARSQLPGLRIAIVYGRRRQGKSYLLRRLVEASGGLYHLATEQTEAISLRRFDDSLSTWQGLKPGSFGFSHWEEALDTTADLMTAGAQSGASPLLVLDEFPYLVNETPGLPSIIQRLYDRIGPGASARRKPLRLILCGSAISVMTDLISGHMALRGRALELRINPFDYRDTREFWDIGSAESAFVHHALIGGTPGYRELVPNPSFPNRPREIGTWLARNVLRPSAPLFGEAARVIHDDPRMRDTATYSSLLAAIAAGESSPTRIGVLLGRPPTSLVYQRVMLMTAGFVERKDHLLLDRRPVVTLADPLLRLHHLVIEPYLADLEAGRAMQVWSEVQDTVSLKILDPHFEALATQWLQTYAHDEADLAVGAAGQATISCREHRTSHEIDILGLAPDAMPGRPGAPIAFIGVAKPRERQPGTDELRRLVHIQDLLTRSGRDASAATFGLFSTTGFTEELLEAARQPGQRVILAGLDTLYGITRR